MHDDPRLYYVGFNLIKGIGSVRRRMLLDFFSDLELAWNAEVSQLQQAGFPLKLAQSVIRIRKEIQLEEVWNKIQSQGITVLTWEDTGLNQALCYPSSLMELDQPPLVLYVRGEISPNDDWAVAIVGTRRITPYGRQVTEEIARYLSQNGITIVSGLARGVDSIAHQTALQANGRTLAILGSGVDRIYPPEHTNLAERIRHQGAIISDYPPGTPPDAVNFPPRNRIISGMTRATLVIEAGERQ